MSKEIGAVLFVGGTGNVGHPTVRFFRKKYPDIQILIGGRDLEKGRRLADEVKNATPVALDLNRSGLGLGKDLKVSAVVMLAADHGLHGLSYAQEQGALYLTIAIGLVEIGLEVALYTKDAAKSPIILASHWLGAASTYLALKSAASLDMVEEIRLGAIYDEKDPAGPAALEDMERVAATATSHLLIKDGKREFVSGDAARGQFKAIDGRILDANAFSTFDTPSLFAVTKARNVRFDLVTGESSSRRRGDDAAAAEIVAEVKGVLGGQMKRIRSTIELKSGAAYLTAFGTVILLGSALGLEQRPALSPGLYLPEQLADPHWYLEQLQEAGVTIHEETT